MLSCTTIANATSLGKKGRQTTHLQPHQQTHKNAAQEEEDPRWPFSCCDVTFPHPTLYVTIMRLLLHLDAMGLFLGHDHPTCFAPYLLLLQYIARESIVLREEYSKTTGSWLLEVEVVRLWYWLVVILSSMMCFIVVLLLFLDWSGAKRSGRLTYYFTVLSIATYIHTTYDPSLLL